MILEFIGFVLTALMGVGLLAALVVLLYRTVRGDFLDEEGE